MSSVAYQHQPSAAVLMFPRQECSENCLLSVCFAEPPVQYNLFIGFALLMVVHWCGCAIKSMSL
eukprot:5805125-Amphidinium_carterae.1